MLKVLFAPPPPNQPLSKHRKEEEEEGLKGKEEGKVLDCLEGWEKDKSASRRH